jgi:hypothetical protein
MDYGDWSGFYDWLRPHPGCIIGVRFWPFENVRFLLDVMQPSGSLTVGSDGQLLLYFGSTRVYESEMSDDQAFDEACIYKSAEDEYGILFGLKHLSEAELRSLQ